MSNLINQSLKIASYATGGLNIAKGDYSQGLLLINSQRQLSQLEEIDTDIQVGNELLYRGFGVLENHLGEMLETTEIGFSELSEGINELSKDIKAVEHGIRQVGSEVVTAIYQQTIEQRVFQSQVIQSNEVIQDVLERVLVANEKQAIAVENPDQTASIEKLKTAKKTIRLFDPELNNFDCINDAIQMSKNAVAIDPFNEEAVFYCAKWMNILGITGWKEMYLDSMQKTKIELENETESQAKLAQENAGRLSIAAPIDIIESLDFKLFGEKFYSFCKKYCVESFSINLEVFYYFYLCSESTEEEANKHLQNCFRRFGKQIFYDEILKNPMALGFEFFWNYTIKEHKDREQAEELDRAQRADYEKFEKERQVELAAIDAEKTKLETKQVKATKEEINININCIIGDLKRELSELSFEPLSAASKWDGFEINIVYGSAHFSSIDVLYNTDHELNCLKWKPSKKKLSSLALPFQDLSSEAIFQLCLENVGVAANELLDIADGLLGINESLFDDHAKLGDIIQGLKKNAEGLSAGTFSDNLENIKVERKFLKNTLNLLDGHFSILSGINELAYEYGDGVQPPEVESWIKEIKNVVKEAFTDICILDDMFRGATYDKKQSLLSNMFDKNKNTELSSDDISRIWNQNIQINDSHIESHEEIKNFFEFLLYIIKNLYPLFEINFEIFNRNKALVEDINIYPVDFSEALDAYVVAIDKDEIGTYPAIEKAAKLFQ